MLTTPVCKQAGLRMVEGMTAEQFADFCFPAGDSTQCRKFFDLIGWPEGYVYCSESRDYAIKTGFGCIQRLRDGR